MTSLIVGASAGLGRALAEELALRGHDLVITGRGEEDLAAIAADLKLRFGVQVWPEVFELRPARVREFRDQVRKSAGKIDNLFLISGFSDLDRDFQQLRTDEAAALVDTNLTTPLCLALAFLDDLKNSPQGNLVGAGTVASARARNSNTVYASAKRGLEFFFAGLRQECAPSKCRIQFYRLGFMRTALTFGQQSGIPYADPAIVARKIADGLGRDIELCYLPKFWRVLMFVYSLMPWFLFQRMRRSEDIGV